MDTLSGIIPYIMDTSSGYPLLKVLTLYPAGHSVVLSIFTSVNSVVWQVLHIHIPSIHSRVGVCSRRFVNRSHPEVSLLFLTLWRNSSASVSGFVLGPLPSHKFRIPHAFALCFWQWFIVLSSQTALVRLKQIVVWKSRVSEVWERVKTIKTIAQ